MARDTVFGVSPRVAKHASDKRAICPLNHLHSQRQEIFMLSHRKFCVSLATNLSRAAKFPRWLNWDTQGDINVARDMSPSLARPAKNQGFSKCY